MAASSARPFRGLFRRSPGLPFPSRPPLSPLVALPLLLWAILPQPLSAQTTFTDVTGYAGVANPNFGVGAAWGDFNGDGYLDLYLVNLGQANALFLNQGDGTFGEIGDPAGVADPGDGVGCAWADYDRDGRLDLFVTNRPGAHRLYRNLGDSTFVDMAPSYGMDDPSGWGESAAWGDYDRDGFIDLLKLRMQQTNILYHNLSGAGFADVSHAAGVDHAGPAEAVAWCDYDGDGDPDLFIANASGANLLYRNDGDGAFTERAGAAGLGALGRSYGCAWGDYDNDGDFDLYVGRSGANKLYRNEGDGTFSDVGSAAGAAHAGWALGVAWADCDNDGWLDLHVANHQGDDVLYRNLANGTFCDVTDSAGVHNTYNGRGNVWGDYDGDGFLDLYVVNHDGAPNVLFHNGGNEHHFLHVTLAGTVSSRDAIGARVVCVAGDLRMTRQVEGGSGFASQNSLPVEFGLGSHMRADSLFVCWPSGIADTLTDLPADLFADVVEGQTASIAGDPALPRSGLPALCAVRPNPFAGSAVLSYYLPSSARVTIEIYDIRGRRITTLADGPEGPGAHGLAWTPAGLPPGIYLCRWRCGARTDVARLSYLGRH